MEPIGIVAAALCALSTLPVCAGLYLLLRPAPAPPSPTVSPSRYRGLVAGPRRHVARRQDASPRKPHDEGGATGHVLRVQDRHGHVLVKFWLN